MKYSDARAVVTGGASGLGNAVARHIVAGGGRVTLLDVQEGPGVDAAKAIGSQATFAKCDVTSETEVNAAMETARPLPFSAVKRPGMGDFLSALTAFATRKAAEEKPKP